MIVRWTAFLLVLVLTWAGISTQARAQGVVEPSSAAIELAAQPATSHGPATDEPNPLESGAQAQPEGLADLPVVILHRPPATVPAACHGWPGATGFAGWVSACLEGLQRPPCAA